MRADELLKKLKNARGHFHRMAGEETVPEIEWIEWNIRGWYWDRKVFDTYPENTEEVQVIGQWLNLDHQEGLPDVKGDYLGQWIEQLRVARGGQKRDPKQLHDASIDDLGGSFMTDDEMLSAANDYFEVCEKLSRTRELESKLKHVLKLIKASLEWKELRIRKGPEALEVVERQTETLDQWNKLRRRDKRQKNAH